MVNATKFVHTQLPAAEYEPRSVRGSSAQRFASEPPRPPPGVKKIPVPPPAHLDQVATFRFIVMTKQGTLTYLMTVNLINSAASKILLMELISR